MDDTGDRRLRDYVNANDGDVLDVGVHIPKHQTFFPYTDSHRS